MLTEVLLICGLLIVASAVPTSPTRHIKGIQIKNQGQERLWIEMTNEDSFSLPPGQMASVILEDTWSGIIFARSEACQFKKCNTPYTVAELIFGGQTKEDRYRVSVIEGYNKPMKIQPTGHSNFCKASYCTANLNQDCPKSHQLKDDEDTVIACRPIPEILKNICPHAEVLDTEMDMFSCKTSDTYFVSIELIVAGFTMVELTIADLESPSCRVPEYFSKRIRSSTRN